MPIPDTTSTGRALRTYKAVRSALEAELDRHRAGGLTGPAVLGSWWEAMLAGRPVEVPAYLLPGWARPPLRAGHPMLTAVVSADDTVVVRAESPAETLARLGV